MAGVSEKVERVEVRRGGIRVAKWLGYGDRTIDLALQCSAWKQIVLEAENSVFTTLIAPPFLPFPRHIQLNSTQH